jgi:two-component system, OmpR family, sensor histidine kinase KdpD
MFTDESRNDPDALLASIHQEESRAKRGRLKIFLGMCPGVGKTYAMLQAGKALQLQGRDVVIGLVETHQRKETAALLDGMEMLPRLECEHKGAVLEELDLDAILRRKPEMVLVDELAHTNADTCRHPKRYQDVQELIDAGISVFTTVNIQHIESRVDVVRQITGVVIRETVPDGIMDQADEMELIDLTPDRLRQRLSEGRVYLADRAQAAAENFFKAENLTALRELSLRYTAEKVDQELKVLLGKRRIKGPWKAHERLLVAVAPSPYAESLIRWTRRQAGMLDCTWTALYVDSGSDLDEESKTRLAKCLSLARELGAEIVSVPGRDIGKAVLDYAREQHITQIVLGKTETHSWRQWLRLSFVDRILRGSGMIDVMVVRPEKDWRSSVPGKKRLIHGLPPSREWLEALGIVTGVTVFSLLIAPFTGYESISFIYLLAVLLAAFRLSRWPVLVLAALGALCWNFLFIPPFYTFYIGRFHDGLMFGLMFLVAAVLGQLTSRLQEREKTERLREKRTATLLAFTQVLASEPETPRALQRACGMIEKLFNIDVCILTRLNGEQLNEKPAEGWTFIPDDKERGVAAWVYSHRKAAGKCTGTLGYAESLHLPLYTAALNLGVLLVKPCGGRSFDVSERALLENFAAQLGFALEKNHVVEAIQRAEVSYRSSILQKTLLDSVSHELKTPLATLQVAASALKDPSIVAARAKVELVATEVSVATFRLSRIVNHLLDMTKLDAGKVEPQQEWCELAELLRDVLDQLKEVVPLRKVELDLGDLPLIKIDPTLLEKALFNLLHNASLYTPAEASVAVAVSLHGKNLVLRVMDSGPGLRAEDLNRIFEKFYRPEGSPAGGSGLGLAIARGLIRSMGGELTAHNGPEKGAIFTITLPVEIK